MNIAICEDIESEHKKLSGYIESYFASLCVGISIFVFESGKTFLADFTPKQYQIVFLDIYLEKNDTAISGIDIAKKIKEIDPGCMFIFSTSSLVHAIEGFALKAVHYLVKPIRYEHVADALSRCKAVIAENMRFIEIKDGGITRKILLKDLMVAEVYNHNCVIYTKSERLEVRITLEELEAMIQAADSEVFLRCHRSYLINMDYVEQLSDKEFTMQNGSKALIRRADSKSVKQTYLDYAFAKTKEF